MLQFSDQLRQKTWSPSSVSCVAARKSVRRSVLGPVRDIADEDVKKPNKQTNKLQFTRLPRQKKKRDYKWIGRKSCYEVKFVHKQCLYLLNIYISFHLYFISGWLWFFTIYDKCQEVIEELCHDSLNRCSIHVFLLHFCWPLDTSPTFSIGFFE